MSYAEILQAEFRRIQLGLPEDHCLQLSRYCSELERWNQKINLTNLRGAELVRRLIVEPSWIAAQLELSGSLTDIGSGNGSPGIPFAVTRPLLNVVNLVESRLKRATFLRHLKGKLDLASVFVHQERFEDAAAAVKGVDWITLQAVALTPDLIAEFRRSVNPTTKIVWITARATPPTTSSTVIRVPGSATEAWVFSLDQS
jgi:16S rRNA (guanine527-N7)-methyltransferase